MTPPPAEAAAAAANNNAAKNNNNPDLEPHQKLEAVAARLAASVGDASELVSAARMLQNDGEKREKERERGKEPAFFLFPSFLLLTPFPKNKNKKSLPTQAASLPRCSGSSRWP